MSNDNIDEVLITSRHIYRCAKLPPPARLYDRVVLSEYLLDRQPILRIGLTHGDNRGFKNITTKVFLSLTLALYPSE